MKTVKLKTFTQNPDNPQKYGDDEIAALVESIRKEPRTLGAAKIAFCTDYTATNGASYAGRRVVIAGNKRLQALQQIAREGGLRDPGDASAWLVSPQSAGSMDGSSQTRRMFGVSMCVQPTGQYMSHSSQSGLSWPNFGIVPSLRLMTVISPSPDVLLAPLKLSFPWTVGVGHGASCGEP